MKQAISEQQFNELPEENRKILMDWFLPLDYTQQLTIGQLIEYMHENMHIELYPLLTDVVGRFLDENTLVDALWLSLKEKI